MKELKKYLPSKQDCKDYTLFLDRDGVINKPIIDDYAKQPEDFIFCDGAIEAIAKLRSIFKEIVIVTNQQGVHREVMTEKDLENVHLKLYNGLKEQGVKFFDITLFAPYLKSMDHAWRKPQNGMLQKAQEYIPSISWDKSIMVGDSPGDMKLADTLGLVKVRITNPQFSFDNQDFQFDSLKEFVSFLSN
jgi:histidinol-phosphate phosphatase family protein